MKRVVFTLIVFCFSYFRALAFFDNQYELFTTQNGLADNIINCISKDNEGFIWLGTDNGLSRYDGNTFQNFGVSRLPMIITNMVHLQDSRTVIVSNKNIYCFDRKMQKFEPCKESESSSVFYAERILPIDNNHLWVIVGDQFLYTQITQANGFLKITILKTFRDILPAGDIFLDLCFSTDHQSIFLLSQGGRVYQFSVRSRKLTILYNDPNYGMAANRLKLFNDRLFILGYLKGIISYHLKKHTILKLDFNDDLTKSLLSHPDVYDLISLPEKKYLAATWNGYTIFSINEKTEKVSVQISNISTSNIYQKVESRMLSAFYDPQGLLWIGTNGGGVILFDLRNEQFKKYFQSKHNDTNDILLDLDGYIWLSTYHKGLMRSLRPFKEGQILDFDVIGSLDVRSKKTVHQSLMEKNGNIWFCNDDGTLTYYERKNGKFTIMPVLRNGKNNAEAIWSIYLDRGGNFWIGLRAGILLYNRTNHKTSFIYHSKRVRAMREDSKGHLWVATEYGLIRLSIKKGKVVQAIKGYENRSSFQKPDARTILYISDKEMYVGYDNGLALVSPEHNAILRLYTSQNGLNNNFIGCITRDAKKNIWVGTYSGISRLDKRLGVFFNFYESGSNSSALCIGKTLLFGNNKAITYFNSEQVLHNSTNHKVRFTSLEVNNAPLQINEERNGQIILTQGISYTNDIRLSQKNNDFAIGFSDLSYSKGNQAYYYRLYPYQKDWIVARDGEKASYTNLPKGKYKFEVKSVNVMDNSSGEISTLNIEILPHWTETLWFRLLMILTVVYLLYLTVRQVERKQKKMEYEFRLENELAMTKMESEKEKQLIKERENFFTYGAHELRTALTLILSPLQGLQSKLQEGSTEKDELKKIIHNTDNLHTLLDHILYLQKINAGMMKLQLGEANIITLIEDAYERFEGLAKDRNISFKFEKKVEHLTMWLDSKKIESAVNNLLSNAFKYTGNGGEISLKTGKVSYDGLEYCMIEVSDNGSGIPDDMQEKIFESFITWNNMPAFSTKIGVGLPIVKNIVNLHHGKINLESVVGKGSVFTILLPIGKEYFKADEFELVPSASNGETIEFKPTAKERKTQTDTLLLIEDNQDVRNYLKELFGKNYNIIEAENGQIGIDLATNKQPDLIISDVMMPVKDGFTCCREIKTQYETSHIPIIMLTAKAEDESQIIGLKIGVDDYMMKPFNPEILIAKVDNLIALRKKLSSIYAKSAMLKPLDEKESDSDEKDILESDDFFMQKVINVIEANIQNENFNVAMLAEKLFMSQPTLYRKLKARSELSAIDLIRSIRMSHAAILIQQGQYSITEIAEIVGYSDTNSFRKHFTDKFGVSPSKYGK